MNLKNLFKLSTLVFLFTLVISSLSFAQVRYLNSTDGRDDNDGLTPTTAYRTLTAAVADFPTGSTIHMAAGNYNYNETVRNANGNDAAGYNLTAAKNLTFIVETYSGNDIAYLNGNGAFNLNIGATKTITFTAADVTKNAVVLDPAAGTESLILTSGTLNVSGLQSFTVGAAVGTSAGGDKISIVNGLVVGTITYASAVRNVVFEAGLSASMNTTTVVPSSNLNTLVISSPTGFTITIPNALTFNQTGVSAITNTDAATVLFQGKVTLADGIAAVALAVPRIINSIATAQWTFAGGIDIITTAVDGGAGVATVTNSNTGKILITGAVTLTQKDAVGYTVTDGNHSTFFDNTGTGTLTVSGGVTANITTNSGVVATSLYVANRTPFLNVRNMSTGTANLGGTNATTIGGVLTTGATAGFVNLTGDITVLGILTNGATHTIKLFSYALNLTGAGLTHANAGNITSTAIGTGLLNFASTSGGLVTLNGAGAIPNIQAGSQALTVAAATNVNGNITANGAGNIILTAVTNVTGGVYMNAAGSVTFSSAAATTISRNVVLATGSTGTFTHGGVLGIGGQVDLNGGTFLMGAAVNVTGDFNQNGGALNFVTFTLTLKKDFYRTVGTVTPGTGTLAFNLGGTQIFQGGTNLLIYNLSVLGLGTGVTINNGSVMLNGDCTIGSNASITLDVYNLRFVALGSDMANAGAYYAANGGRVIFEGPDDGGGVGVAGTVHTITGTGSYGDMEIALADEDDYVSIGAGETITFAGLVILRQGTIQIPATSTLNPILAGTGKIRRNMGDLNAAGSDGRSFVIVAGGQFAANNAPYDLEYYGTTSGNEVAGNEFYIGAAGALVRNLTITATDGTIDGAKLVQFPTDAAGDYKFTGNLSIAALVEIDVTGTSNLISTGVTAANSIVGQILNSGAGEFQVTGGTVTGAAYTTTAPVPTAKVAKMRVLTADTQNLNQLWTIGALTIDATNTGVVNIGMEPQGSPLTPGLIFAYTQNAGNVVLTNNVQVEVFASTAGIFDLANFNVWISDLSAGAPADAFTANGTATFAITGADATHGFLQFRSTAAGLNTQLTATTAVAIPRVEIDPANLGGGVTVTLGGTTQISDILYNKDASSTLAFATFRLIHSGNTWTTLGLYTSGGAAGVAYITGPVTMNLQANTDVPYLRVDNGTNEFKLVDAITGAGVPDLTVSQVFTMTAGTINLQNIDILLPLVGGGLVYTNGTINATTGETVPFADTENGEIVFTGAGAHSFTITTTNALSIPNLTLTAGANLTYTGGGVAGAPTFTVTKHFGFGANVVMGAAGEMVFGDNAWIEASAGTMDFVPAFGTNINYCYNGLTPTGNELTTSATKIQKFYVNATVTLSYTGTTTVNNELALMLGNVVTTATKTMTMGANSLVTVLDGTINVAATANANLLGGPIDLTYMNTVARNTSNGEWPATMVVNTFRVMTDIAVPTVGGAAAPLVLHASRSVGDFVLETDQAAIPQNGTQFDLNGLVLTVTNATSATLTRGALVSYKTGVAGTSPYQYGTLSVAGVLTQTADASISNVIVTANTATLAGTFGTEDYDGAGANHTVPATLPTMTIATDASVAGFNGNLSVDGNTTITGAYTGGTLTAGGDVTVATGGSMNAATNLEFVGSADATFTVPSAGATIGAITFNKTTGTIYTIELVGGSVAATGLVTFTNGLFKVPDGLLFNITAPLLGGGQGFTHVVADTDLSHVFGSVSKTLRNTTGFLAGATEQRSEFPVGSEGLYRPVALNFNPQFGVPTVPNITVVAKHIDGVSPQGTAGLPIIDGVSAGVNVSRFPSFYWYIYTTPTSVSPSIVFDLELGATGFTNYDDVNNVRIIRRHSNALIDPINQWLLQGENTGYDNSVNGGVPTIINRGAAAGLRSGGAIFTLGLKSRLTATAFANQLIGSIPGGAYQTVDVALAGHFTGPTGTELEYTAVSSNASIASVTYTGSTLSITGVSNGECDITVKATDQYNDFITTTIHVVVNSLVGNDKDVLPTEFALSQNYPNPFNPTTAIRYALPSESHVTIRVYNMLAQEVATLVNEVKSAGYHTINFNANGLASGRYIAVIKAGEFNKTIKMNLLK